MAGKRLFQPLSLCMFIATAALSTSSSVSMYIFPCRPLAPTCVVVGIPMESSLLFGASFQILNTERKCAVGLRSAGIAALNDWLKNLTPLRDKKTEQFRGLSPCLN